MNNQTSPAALGPEPHVGQAADILAGLSTTIEHGLSTDEVALRLKRYGANTLRMRQRTTWLRILRNQFESPVVGLLAAAAVVSFLFGEWKESGAIAVVLLINGLIGFSTEVRALRSMEALRGLGNVTTRVKRDGRSTVVSAERLVPGDIVLLEGGDVVTADLRLIEASNLYADESALTGESVAVEKETGPVDIDAPIAERSPMAYKGTSLTGGSGTGVVVATGMQSELGKISALVEEAKPEHSPLEKQLERLGGHLIRFTLVVVVAIGVVGFVSGQDTVLMIQTAIALAVAAIPEGLPIVATMALARGMWRMARQNALIERLAAVETLGATTVILTDKTGTLTENRMEVQEIILGAGATNIGVSQDGFSVDGNAIEGELASVLDDMLTAAVLCNNAELSDTGMDGVGDPMELALLRVGRISGKEQTSLLDRCPKQGEVAFDSETKMMATTHASDGEFVVFVKGAPEVVLEHTTRVTEEGGTRKLERHEIESWSARIDELAERGMRVLAIAMKHVADAGEPAYEDLVFLGLLGLHDPPREDVVDAIAHCHKAGIRVVMVTGDHGVTARSIAKATGIAGAEARVIEGRTLGPIEDLSDDERQAVLNADVFARVDPAQKLDLVSVYQKAGEIVAMTGDGVNDAPALKKADIGVAMGQRGTQVAREAAAMVLRDDAFSTIVAAIREGRVIFRNIQSFVSYLLSCNLSEILIVGLAVGIGLPLPLLPLQILFLNLVTDVFPAFALGAGEGNPQVLKHHPRDPAEPILTRTLWIEIVGHATSITFATLGALIIARTFLNLEGDAAVTVSFLTLAFAQLWHVFNMSDSQEGMFVNDVTRNGFVWGALLFCTALLLAATFTPVAAELLHLQAPEPNTWALIAVMSAVPLLLGQIGKRVAARLSHRSASA